MDTNAPKTSGPLKPPKKAPSVFALAAAAFLGTLSGSLPWLASLQGIVSLVLTFFRVPLLCFLFFFALIKFLTDRYLADKFSAWGLHFLTSSETIDVAQQITQAPLLCLLGLNRASLCGRTLFGLAAGTAMAILLAALAGRVRKKSTPPP